MSEKNKIKDQVANQKGSSGPAESKKSEGAGKRKFSVMKPFKDFMSGEFLRSGVVERNLPFLGFLTVLMLFYIGYQYYVDNSVRQQVREDKEYAELYSKLQSVKEEFNTYSLQSTVAEGTAEIGLYESIDPPIVIPVGKGEIKE